jgi:uncharacterized protein
MITHSTPGVYFEWQEPQTPPELARADIAGFIGIAERGKLHTPTLIENWSDFRQHFGGHIAAGYLAYAVESFFLNGGRRCYVVRVADPDWAESAELELEDGHGNVVRLTASSPGVWARRMSATVLPLVEDRFNLFLGLDEETVEIWRDLTLVPGEERWAVDLLVGKGRVRLGDPHTPRNPTGPRSALVDAQAVTGGPPDKGQRLRINAGRVSGYFEGGTDGLWTLRPAHLSGRGAPPDTAWGLATLESVPEIAIVAMPDLMPAPFTPVRRRLPQPVCDPPMGDQDFGGMLHPEPQLRATPAPDHPPIFDEDEVLELQRELVAHCDRLKDRIAVLDARRADHTAQDVVEWRRNFDSSYAALYYPWLRVPDPLHPNGSLRTIPPSGHIAGLYAAVEQASGAHQPPANERIENAQDVTVAVEDVIHGYLNDQRVNVIRAYPGRGLRPMGARTLSSDPQWRYVNVRRLLLVLERTLRSQTQWLAFESNHTQLRANAARVLRGILDRMWQRGMLDGPTRETAYQVICDETSNPAYETEAGRLIAVIALRPPHPAEFVIVRVGRTDQGLQLIGESEA